MAAKKTSNGTTSSKTSKTAFVLSFPLDMPAGEIVAAGTEAGISLTNPYVHTIRSIERRKAGQNGLLQNGEASRAVRRGAADTNKSTDERFIAMAFEVGLLRAHELLAEVRAKMLKLPR